METATLIISIISASSAFIGVLISILALILNLRMKQQTAVFATKYEYEKIIDFCKCLSDNNDIRVRLKKNLDKDIDELRLLGVLFGELYARRFYKFTDFNSNAFKEYINELETIYQSKMKSANSTF